MGDSDKPSLWTAETLARACGGTLDGPAAWSVSGLSIDSRSLEPGDLFVALKDVRDGHDFVAGAFASGAPAALVTRRPDGVGADAPLVLVEDTLTALAAIGAARRAESNAGIAAVTGSVGKTGTVAMLRLALGATGATHGPDKSFNNHIGVPLTLARMPAQSRFGVFEIGMNHAGEITPLTRLVRPHVAIVTTVEAVHLEFFDSVDGIAEAKAEIFLGLEPDGTAVINADNRYRSFLEERARQAGAASVVTFGSAADAGVRLLDFDADENASRITAVVDGRQITYSLPMPGRHHALNSLAVLAAIHALGADLAGAAQALQGFQAGAGRGARHDVEIRGGVLTLLDESYNASPPSMAAAFETLGQATPPPGGRRIAILGDMLELGPDSRRFHADLAPQIEAAGIDLVFCAGPDMHHLWQALPAPLKGAWRETSRDLAQAVVETVRAGDIVMVKGSLGSGMRVVVDELLAKRLKSAKGLPGSATASGAAHLQSARGQDEGV